MKKQMNTFKNNYRESCLSKIKIFNILSIICSYCALLFLISMIFISWIYGTILCLGFLILQNIFNNICNRYAKEYSKKFHKDEIMNIILEKNKI